MRPLLLALLLLIPPCLAADQSAEADGSFESLLAEGELQFNAPEGYLDLPAGRTPTLDYERALRSPDGMLEIRIAVRPLKRLRIDYDDPHGAVPNPNHIFPLVFESLATRLSGGGHAPSNDYPPDRAREKFNADWAAAAVSTRSRNSIPHTSRDCWWRSIVTRCQMPTWCSCLMTTRPSRKA